MPPGNRDPRWSEIGLSANQAHLENLSPQLSPERVQSPLVSTSLLSQAVSSRKNVQGFRKISEKKYLRILIALLCLIIGAIAGLVLHLVRAHEDNAKGLVWKSVSSGFDIVVTVETGSTTPMSSLAQL